MQINGRFFLIFLIIFLIEIGIALWVNDRWIRPLLGDALVVILIFCFVRSFFPLPTIPLAVGVLLFAYTVEFAQYFELVDRLGLADNRLAATVIGTTFDWRDLLAYTAGVGIILLIHLLGKADSSEFE